jgi:hypothetical protein
MKSRRAKIYEVDNEIYSIHTHGLIPFKKKCTLRNGSGAVVLEDSYEKCRRKLDDIKVSRSYAYAGNKGYGDIYKGQQL